MHPKRFSCSLILLLAIVALTPGATQAGGAPVGRWIPTGALTQNRGFQTATLLPSGQVLVAGGCTDKACDPTTPAYLASAELYNPQTGTWATTTSMHAHRVQFTATLLRDGRVLVAGGWSGTDKGYLASAELYNPRTGRWTVTGSLQDARGWHTATLLKDGRVLVVGGGDGSAALASAELYNPRTRTWTVTDPLSTPRSSHTATLLPSGQVLVAGGNNQGPLASAELYTPRTGKWTVTGSLHDPRRGHMATLLGDGSVLVTGGTDGTNLLASTELYHPRTGQWTTTGALHDTRFYSTAQTGVVLPTGQVLVAGTGGCPAGGGGICTGGSPLASAELYTPRTGRWTKTGSLHALRSFQTMTLLFTGQVLVAGGTDNNGILASAELYTPRP